MPPSLSPVVPRPPRVAPVSGSRARAGSPRSLWIALGVVVVAATALGLGALDALTRRPPPLLPRHRAEALCFALAQPPAYAPPMTVQPSAALVRGRFGAGIPAGYAIQELMGFSDDCILRSWTQHVGDFGLGSGL